ncbi:uncharacterized protein BX664DRAFT_314911 [Halteromyces radiatus]|uniref:uncharacterized protein n=1 Tax=Halteromyces radiatus TaxID=101107 RepID=UPI0022211C12|nr:uncharacterized protein BX664DRAFT_314911 [Halteromyces radiatus]KAI8089735.1 hypothetical protein BX664DRAFT_314911 [Halteromyces radiatus]
MQFNYAQVLLKVLFTACRTNPSFYCIVIDTLTLAHDPSFWSDEDHGVLIFVCLQAMDLVEDDQSLESFMNLVTEFCAQVGGGQNATLLTFAVFGLERSLRIISMTDSGALYIIVYIMKVIQTSNDIAKIIVYTIKMMQTFNDIAKIVNHTTKPRSDAFYVGMALLSN